MFLVFSGDLFVSLFVLLPFCLSDQEPDIG